MRLIDYGEHAVLLELDDTAVVPWLRAAVGALDGVVDAVAGARTVLAVLDHRTTEQDRATLSAVRPVSGTRAGPCAVLVVPVVYDGEDLDEVAGRAGLTRDAVVALHSGADHVVRFCGFSPGFGYLDGLPAALHQPRRREPRARVPAGSVAIAGEFTGVYPRASPGGWLLLGRTDLALWDERLDPPARLAPGTRVRFEAR